MDELREKVARELCGASGQQWRTGTYEVMSGKDFAIEEHDLGKFNNHWLYKADRILAMLKDEGVLKEDGK